LARLFDRFDREGTVSSVFEGVEQAVVGCLGFHVVEVRNDAFGTRYLKRAQKENSCRSE